jgi:hypothetical protein
MPAGPYVRRSHSAQVVTASRALGDVSPAVSAAMTTPADHGYTAMTTVPLAWCPSMWATAFAVSASG